MGLLVGLFAAVQPLFHLVHERPLVKARERKPVRMLRAVHVAYRDFRAHRGEMAIFTGLTLVERITTSLHSASSRAGCAVLLEPFQPWPLSSSRICYRRSPCGRVTGSPSSRACSLLLWRSSHAHHRKPAHRPAWVLVKLLTWLRASLETRVRYRTEQPALVAIR